MTTITQLRALRLPLVLGAVLLAGFGPSACMKPNPLVYTLADDETGRDEDETGRDEDETSATEAETAGPGPDLGASSCMPVEAFGEVCGACLAEACCDLSSACEDDPDCLCLLSCEIAGGSKGSCQQSCGANPKQVPVYEALDACASETCAASC